MKRFLYITYLFWLWQSLLSQEAYKINFTTADGLPSNEVYCAYQDTSGYMWFGTENGVTRFDGYTFENFGIKNGLDKLEVNQILPDRNGNVWFSSFFGKVYSWRRKQFDPYPYNHILEKYKKKSNLVNLQHIDSEGTFYFRINYVGILMISKDGKEELLQPDCGVCNYIVKTKSGFIISENIGNSKHKQYLLQQQNSLKNGPRIIIYHDLGKNIKTILTKFNEPNNSNNTQTLLWNSTVSLFTLFKKTYNIEDGILDPVIESPSLINIYFKNSNDLYIGHQRSGGLHIYRNWSPSKKGSPEKWLEGSEVSWIMKDRNEGLWVTTINNGIFYFPNDEMKVYQSEELSTSKKFTALVPLGLGFAQAISYDGTLISLKENVVTTQIKFDNVSNLHDLAQNEKFIFLRGIKVDKNKKHISYHRIFPNKFERKNKSASFYGSDRYYLFLYNPQNQSFDRIADEKKNTDFIWDLYRDHHNVLWIATNGGLKTWENDEFCDLVPSLQNIKTISIDQLKNGTMAVGTKGSGIYLLNGRHEIIDNITVADGLSTDIIEYLWVDEFDDIWVATLKGLHKISLGKNNVPLIRQYHTYHGLPSEEVLMVRTLGADVWLATGKGVTYFKKDTLMHTTFKPEIIHFLINGETNNTRKVLNYQENTISITLKNYDFAMGAKVVYRYRLHPQNEWTMQASNNLNFINLAPDHYNIEVQAQNKDGYWSKSLFIPFIIQKPWWLTWTFLICLFLALCYLGYTYYRSKMNEIKVKQQLKNQMLEFEKKALLAQMNPHFIFNAFSAIQYYINTDKIKKADEYLTDLSYLIRKILDNSTKKDILLHEEIALLQTYTSLEEIRFDHKFSIHFQIDDNIDTEATRLPAMLVQPLLENAINHGLMHLKERKGKLSISIMDHQGGLMIDVEDNGVGIQKAKNLSHEKQHESYGLKLLQDRIKSYAISGDYKISLTHSDLYENEEPAGTKFSLIIHRY